MLLSLLMINKIVFSPLFLIEYDFINIATDYSYFFLSLFSLYCDLIPRMNEFMQMS